MKLCFSTLGCPDWDVTEVAKQGKIYGFDGVELRIHGERHIDPSLNPSQRRKVKEMFADAGLAIAIISGYTRYCGDDKAMLEENVANQVINAQLAVDLGVPYVRTFLGDGAPLTEAGILALRKACNEANKLGITVLMEIHDALSSGKLAAELIKNVDSPGLGILWDIHHSLNSGETPAETWGYVGEFIRHVHIKDARADGKVCLMGQGTLPVNEITSLLKEKGFGGYLSFEWEKTWIPELEPPEVALPQYIKYMRGL